MEVLIAILGALLIGAAIWDGIETLVLPRSVEIRLSVSTVYYSVFWSSIQWVARRIKSHKTQQAFLSAYSPVSVLSLIAIWASLIVIGYAMLYYGLHVPFTGDVFPPFSQLVYASGITFFTVGYGDMTPISNEGHALAVLEAATGFGFLGLVIGYVPVLYSSFSRREGAILLLDSKAGSEPTAFKLIHRHAEAEAWPELVVLLKDWEQLCATMLENYISFPVLAYYRSQHDHQSWLRSVTAILDTCALLESSLDDADPNSRALRFQSRATFAIGRHLIVDIAYILGVKPDPNLPSRLSESAAQAIRVDLSTIGAPFLCCPDSEAKFAGIRREYEPFVAGLAEEIILELPVWRNQVEKPDNWQISAWDSARHF